MKIKSHRPSLLKRIFKTEIFKNKILSCLVIYNLLLIILFIVFYLAFAPNSLKRIIDIKIINPTHEALLRTLNQIKYWRYTKTRLEKLNLDISFKNYQKLEYKRYQSIQNKELYGFEFLTKTADDWVPATINHNDKIYDVKIRLKGRLPDHWLNKETWSLNVRVKGSDTLMGMKNFSIQHPQVRDFLNEWTLHQLFKYSGLIYMRYDFIDVSINGKTPVLYAMEEGLEKYLIERNQLREGPIFKINNDFQWFYEQMLFNGLNLQNGELELFDEKANLEDPEKLKQFKYAKNLFELFRQEKLKASEVFDVKSTAKLFALIELTGAHHALAPDNCRFYFNPITARIEIIGRDHQVFKPTDQNEGLLGERKIVGQKNKLTKWEWASLFFKDEIFFKEYIKALEEVSQEKYLNNFYSQIQHLLEEKRILMEKRYPFYGPKVGVAKKILYDNQKYIRDVLFLERPIIRAYLQEINYDGIETLFFNSTQLPIEITKLIIDNQEIDLPQRILLQPYFGDFNPKYQKTKINLPDKIIKRIENNTEIKFKFNFLGASKIFEDKIFPWSLFDDEFINNDIFRQKSNANEFSFLSFDETAKKIKIQEGAWNINKNIIIPSGYTLTGEGKITLNLVEHAKILSFSAIQFKGTPDNPITITSSDKTGEGFIVINAIEKSELNYVRFKNLTFPEQNNWKLTGAVVFYESPVDIYGCIFEDNNSEDALNIIRSSFTIENSLFQNTKSDAFDGDFVTGEIKNSKFKNLGNDAIDVSGSRVKISNINIDHAGDKGLSVGEASQVEAINFEIKNSELGVASKDGSQATLENFNFTDCKVALTVYQKKSEYTPATITAKHINFINIVKPFIIEDASVLILDEKEIKGSSQHVKEIFYGNTYGKSSR